MNRSLIIALSCYDSQFLISYCFFFYYLQQQHKQNSRILNLANNEQMSQCYSLAMLNRLRMLSLFELTRLDVIKFERQNLWGLIEQYQNYLGLPGDIKLNSGALLAYEMDWFETGARRKRWEDTSRSKVNTNYRLVRLPLCTTNRQLYVFIYILIQTEKEKEVSIFFYL